MNLPSKKKRLGDMLVDEGVITSKQLERAIDLQREKGGRLGDILINLNLCTEEVLYAAMAKRAGIPFKNSLSRDGQIPKDVLLLMPEASAKKQGVLPVAREKNILTVAVSDPFSQFDVVDELKIQTGCEINLVMASEHEIQKAIDLHYKVVREAGAGSDEKIETSQMETTLRALLDNAVKMGADQIYLEPSDEAVHVRYRVRGELQSRPDLPLNHQNALVAYVKGASRLNVAECWLPQDGRLRRTVGPHVMDVRVTTLPTFTGEKVVLEILETSHQLPLDLSRLGFDEESLDSFKKLLELPRGLILVAGPIRSGKTVTMYAALSSLIRPGRHILSIEDPVERTVEGVTQIQARPDARFTLAAGLHLLRRQGPDVIMVTEIRDQETAQAALAAASQCLVLAGIGADDTLSAIERMYELSRSPVLLGSTLAGILAQRLIRTVCPNCRESYTSSLRQIMSQGVSSQEVRGAKRADSFTLYRSKGCGQCLGTGFQGVAPVFEILVVDDIIRRLVSDRAPIGQLVRATAERATLREAAVQKAFEGFTSLEEALNLR